MRAHNNWHAYNIAGNTNPGLFSSLTLNTAGELNYELAADQFGTATISVTVQDNGETDNGGVNTSAPQTFTITVTPVNDQPIAVDDTASTPEDTPLILAAADLTGGDSAGPANEGQGLTVQAVMDPVNGTVSISNGQITFTPDENYHGTASFRYTVFDDDATNPLSDVGLVTITVTSVNEAPAGADNTLSFVLNGTNTFAAADFGFTDAGESEGNNFARVKIATVPTAGKLTLGGAELNQGDFVTVDDIDAGHLQFEPDAGGTGLPYATFTFQVEDDGGTADGGVDLDPSPNTMTLLVWKLTTSGDCAAGESPEASVSGHTVTLGLFRRNAQTMPNCIHGASAKLPPLTGGQCEVSGDVQQHAIHLELV